MLTATQTVRHLERGEALPDYIQSGLQGFTLDENWVWVYDDNGIKAVLVACPCHGIVQVWRVAATPDAPKTAILRMLREGIREVRELGYIGVMVFLETTSATDIKLAKIATRFKLKGIPRIGFWCGGRL